MKLAFGLTIALFFAAVFAVFSLNAKNLSAQLQTKIPAAHGM